MDLTKLINILMTDIPSEEIKRNEDEIFKLIPELKICKGFDQNNPWHDKDVYNHTLMVVDNVDKDISLRLAALFHDIGKPKVYTIGSDGYGHFLYHWIESLNIFNRFLENNYIDPEIIKEVSDLILFHDLRVNNASGDRLEEFYNTFDTSEKVKKIFNLKRADLLSQNHNHERYNESFDELYNQEQSLISRLNTLK